jgi:hypothetical protein
MNPRYIEGVPYYRHIVGCYLKDGSRHRLTLWSPGFPWVRQEAGRMLDALFGVDNIRERSVTIRCVV